MTKPKTLAVAAFAALFSLSLAGTALAQATPATPPANAQKGQAKKEDKALKDKASKDKAAKDKAAKEKKAQGQKKGMDDGKKTGIEKKKSS